jgi:hypothetical protein
MQMNLDEAAKSYIGIPIDRVIDEEERYYISDIGKYDAFIDGAKWMQEQYSKMSIIDITCDIIDYEIKQYAVEQLGIK